MRSLNSRIQDEINTDTKCELLHHLWGVDVHPTRFYESDYEYELYFAYYTAQCRDALHDGGRYVFVRTHRQIVQVAQHLKSSLDRNSIKQLLRPELQLPKPANEDEVLDGSMDLVASLLLMVEFGDLHYGFTGRKQLSWVENSFRECIHQYFGVVPILGHDSMKLERVFNAMNLGRIAGIEIHWTDNLADHLRLIDGDKKVAIFHHASFLECQQHNPLLPSGLVEETLRTLALLIPGTDKCSREWFKKLSASQNLDSKVINYGRLWAEDLRIENFRFWHDRLVVLKQLFDEAEPSSLSQWWHDRRKGVQWYTFWIAALIVVLTLFFGVVQCIEGALQVYKAFNP